MQKVLISLLCGASLGVGGCASTDEPPGMPEERSSIPLVYRPDIQQGNVVDQEMVDRLRPGMTRHQVRYVMGTPTLVDVFHADRWDYYYSILTTADEFEQQRVTLFFKGDRLTRIEGSLRPGAGQAQLKPEPEGVITVPDYKGRD